MEFRDKYGHSGTSESCSTTVGLSLCFSIFEETKTKLVLETVHYLSFSLKLIWNHLYLVTILSFILNYLQKYILQLEHPIELLVYQ